MYLEFEHEDEDCAISTSATPVTFDDIIELANYLAGVEFSDSDQEPTLQWQSEYGFSLRSLATYHPQEIIRKFYLKRLKGPCPCVSGRDLQSIKSSVEDCISLYTKERLKSVPFSVCLCVPCCLAQFEA